MDNARPGARTADGRSPMGIGSGDRYVCRGVEFGVAERAPRQGWGGLRRRLRRASGAHAGRPPPRLHRGAGPDASSRGCSGSRLAPGCRAPRRAVRMSRLRRAVVSAVSRSPHLKGDGGQVMHGERHLVVVGGPVLTRRSSGRGAASLRPRGGGRGRRRWRPGGPVVRDVQVVVAERGRPGPDRAAGQGLSAVVVALGVGGRRGCAARWPPRGDPRRGLLPASPGRGRRGPRPSRTAQAASTTTFGSPGT